MLGKLAIWGASGHALVVADIIGLMASHDLVGFIDDINPEPRLEAGRCAPVLGGREQLARLRNDRVTDMLIAVGDCAARLELANVAEAHGFRLITAVHPRATIARDVEIGPGTVVCAGAVIGPGCRIGANVIVNTSASVDHECILEDGVHVSPGAHLAGNVRVGRAAWVCIGANVGPRVRIGAGSILGAGSVLLHDLPDDVVAYGVPATVTSKANTL